MKLLIGVDMEGATGIVSWDQVDPRTAEYQRCRHLLTADVNAAIQGAREAGITDIQVADGHWNSGNVLIEELDPGARLSTGTPSPFSMVQGIQDGVDGVFFVGYHARAGSRHAVMDHTWSSTRVMNLWLNDRLAGETALNAAVCGGFHTPVVLVTGDQAVAAEAQDWVPGIETAVVKLAAGRNAALCLPPGQTGPLIRAAAKRAAERLLAGQAPAPLDLGGPVAMRLELGNSLMADMASLAPGVTRLDGRTLSWQAPDMPTGYQQFRAVVSLAGA